MSSRRYNLRRPGADVNQNLDENFMWPQHFGEETDQTTQTNQKPDPSLRNLESSTSRQVKLVDTNEVQIDSLDQLSNNREETTSHASRVSRKSTASSSARRRDLAIKMERAKQEIEMKKLELDNQLRLMQIEHDFRQEEINEGTEIESVKSIRGLYPTVKVITPGLQPPSPKSSVQEWIDKIETSHPKEPPFQPQETNDIQLLCKTLTETLRIVGKANEERRNYRSMEKDFPIFDGNPAEWPMFLSQFQLISSMCEYFNEEKMVKLQKCLRGEARFAVSGMMMCPGNVNLVINTLEMRFGRPDQIIETLIDQVRAIHPIKDSNFEKLIIFSNHVRNLVETMKSLDCTEHLKNPQLLKELIVKIPDMLKLQWGDIMYQYSGKADLIRFSEWLNSRANSACFVNNSRIKTTESFPHNHRFQPKPKHEVTLSTNDRNNSKLICFYCDSKGHKISSCTKMKEHDIDTRWSVVTKKKLCFSCLSTDHQTFRCDNRKLCGIKGCRRPHHKLLHKDFNSSVSISSSNNSNDTIPLNELPQLQNPPTSNVERVNTTRHNMTKKVLLRTVNVRLYSQNGFIDTVALLDEASTVTLADESIVEELGLKGYRQPLCIQWTNNIVNQHENSVKFDVDISGCYRGARIFSLKNVHSVKDLSLPFQSITRDDWNKYSYLRGLPLNDINSRPMILIGQDNINLTVPRKVCQGSENMPMATKTHLGWILHGPTYSNKDEYHFSLHTCLQEQNDNDLHDLVKQTFSIESFAISTRYKNPDSSVARAIKIMEKTIEKVDNHFQIGLLWKNDNIELPDSKSMAIKRLHCVEKRMSKDENFRRQYTEKIQSYLNKNYARVLSPEEARIESPHCWYLPHFGVVNPKNPNKFRLVFDAAAKSQGVSLNDNLVPGPDLLTPLVAVLIRFRQWKVAFCSDIEEMFHQVRIIPKDQCAQRFLWRSLEVYQMQVMIFGATCSPACAQYVKNHNARETTQSPDILNAILKKHNVDDYLDSKITPDEALTTILEVQQVHREGGFNLVNWISNSREVMDRLGHYNDIVRDMNFNDDTTLQRILGLWWNAKDDFFQFKLSTTYDSDSFLDKKPTKREVLKIVMSVFDPLGFIANFTIRGRILIQDIWKSGIGWDDYIDEELYENWTYWTKDLIDIIPTLQIPRCYSPLIPESDRLELHIFCDSSMRAFATVAYLRVVSKNVVKTSLVMAKARVAPNKTLSIPRLELQAALMGSRMANCIKEEMEIKIHKNFFWTDPSTIIHWIKGNGKKLGQFESHRVGEILELTNICDWYWIPTDLNIADEATRTYSTNNRDMNFIAWFSGPEFLKEVDSTKWPKRTFIEESKEGYVQNVSVNLTFEYSKFDHLPDTERFSNWFRLIRTTCWILRSCKIWLKKLRKDPNDFPNYLTSNEIKTAEKKLIEKSQNESFFEDIVILKEKKALNKRSRLRKLCPEVNEEGLLVLRGRLDLAEDFAISVKRPYILDPKNAYTKLLLKHFHERYGHQGVELVLAEVRQRFWIIDARSAVRTAFSNCMKCRKSKAKPVIPLMGQLPLPRLTPNQVPFTYTGMDYFGPLYVSVGRRKEKRWGVMFTCMTIRAVHLEISHSMTADSTIMALRRMISRRGTPKIIFSDNGTNLRGASVELRESFKEFDQTKLGEEMAMKGIEWKFIPPGGPHMGGTWERLIKSVKKTFKVILNHQTLKDEIISTIFCEVENIINSRPLTQVSIDPNDLEPLTPNHFLLGKFQANGSPGPMTSFDDGRNLRKQWRKSQQLVNCFWKRWIKEYIPQLMCRKKWTDDNDSIKEGEVVIIINENAPRNNWKLGVVQKLFPGQDGKVRVVEVKTQTGIFRRPVAKLCPLKTEDSINI